MNEYERAFQAIDEVICWCWWTAASTHEERMMKIDREADKLRAYIDSRRAMMEAQSADGRFAGVPMTLRPSDKCRDDRAGDADDRGENGNKKAAGALPFGLGVLFGLLAAGLLHSIMIRG